MTVNSIPTAILSGSGLTSSTICFGEKPIFSAIPTSGVSYTFYVNGQPVESAAVSGSVFNSASTTLNLDQLSAASSPTIIGLKITTPSGCSAQTH